MLPASVGFQCPDCVKAGARSTRSGRTPYGGRRVSNAGLTSQVLIGINVFVWLLIMVTGGAASEWVYRLALIPDGLCLGAYAPPGASSALCSEFQGFWFAGVAEGAWWQIVTSMFTHEWVVHIAFNMLALWSLGPQLELALGRVRFLALYLLSGLGGSALVYLLSDPNRAALGASGAVFGLIGALLILAIKVRGDVQSILFWIGINAAITVFGASFISWQGHLGGFLGGVALMALFAYAPRGPRRSLWQAAGLAAYSVALVALFAARTLTLA